MKCIVYVSETLASFNASSLMELGAFCSDRNSTMQITGYLYYERARFIQYIEGPDEPTDSLMSDILLDTRHNVLIHQHDTELFERRFPSWAMRTFDRDALIEIKLEHVVSDELLFSRGMQLEKEWGMSVRRMVDALAKVRS